VAKYRDLCSACREPTDAVCFRCKAPLCSTHLPDPTRRCRTCELEYRYWPSREPRVLGIGAALLVLWIGVIAALVGRLPEVAGIWALAFPLVVGAIAARRLENGRSIFLRQEKRRRAAADGRKLHL
jgi:hypothetical protein